ncbi:hypothetical protein CHUAL_007935 [Chamberlinius hualienensis]
MMGEKWLGRMMGGKERQNDGGKMSSLMKMFTLVTHAWLTDAILFVIVDLLKLTTEKVEMLCLREKEEQPSLL